MMKYAGIYITERTNLDHPRRAAAATRLAHYEARRAARRDGYVRSDNPEVRVVEEHPLMASDPPEVAVRVTIDVYGKDNR